MAGGRLRGKEIPYCALFLVLGSLLCHTLVLVGNLQASSAMEDIGKSTAGWSKVGTGLSRSFLVELDNLMHQVSCQLLATLEHIAKVQMELDKVVGSTGESAEVHVESHTKVVFLQLNSSLEQRGLVDEAVLQRVVPLILQGVDKVVEKGIETVNDALHKLMLKLKPALNQIGEWLVKFGPKIQSAIEAFSSSLDKVQKIFDKILEKLNGKGDNEDMMLEETFGLFDVSNTGTVTAEDLKQVGELYSIGALQGDKPMELVQAYDQDGDARLTQAELKLLIGDESIPNSLPVVLRTYAKKLSQLAGNVAAARMRDELVSSIVNYFQLVCAKNQTKVQWIADALGNAILPLDFTSAIFAQLCLMEDDPNALTTADIGGIVITTMYFMHHDQTIKALDNMANASFWIINGFPPLDQPRCVKRVTQWVVEAQTKNVTAYLSLEQGRSEPEQTKMTSVVGPNGMLEQQLSAAKLQTHHPVGTIRADGTVSIAALSGGQSLLSVVDLDVLAAMPARAESIALANMRNHLHRQQLSYAVARAKVFSTGTSHELLLHLTGGKAASDKKNPNAERALHAGQPAQPETLKFARYLSSNATATANRFQDMSFIYSSQSSGALDTFATQVQALVKKMQSFLEMMMKWATPAGMKRLDKTVDDFRVFARMELMKNVKKKVEGLVDKTLPKLSQNMDKKLHQTPNASGHKNGKAIEKPLERVIQQPLSEVAGDFNNTKEGQRVGQELAPKIGALLGNTTGKLRAEQLETLLGKLVNKALDKLEERLNTTMQQEKAPAEDHASLMEESGRGIPIVLSQESIGNMEPQTVADDAGQESGAWQQLVTVLTMLDTLLPTATSTLKFARTEVSKASASLNSVFAIFEIRGPAIFNRTAQLYALLWILWFAFLLPLTLFNLYYCMWASGWFGGPQPLSEEQDAESPNTFLGKIRICCNSCCTCIAYYHDTQCCFWGFIILLQMVVLIIFLISIVLCIIAGVKAFILSGCAQVYMLGDPAVCRETVGALRNFLSSFFVRDAIEQLDEICPNNHLLTCHEIKIKMQSSVILTTIFSFLATILSLQMLIEAAVLHEQARYRRLFNKICFEDEVPGGKSSEVAAPPSAGARAVLEGLPT